MGKGISDRRRTRLMSRRPEKRLTEFIRVCKKCNKQHKTVHKKTGAMCKDCKCKGLFISDS